MKENQKIQSVYIQEVLIIKENCPHCHCNHSLLNQPAQPGAIPFHKLNGQKIFFRRPKKHNRRMHQRNITLVQLQQAVTSPIQQNTNAKKLEDWIDSQEVMQKLCISKRKLQMLRDNGTLPFGRLKNKTYYKVSDLVDLLEKSYASTKSKIHGKK